MLFLVKFTETRKSPAIYTTGVATQIFCSSCSSMFTFGLDSYEKVLDDLIFSNLVNIFLDIHLYELLM